MGENSIALPRMVVWLNDKLRVVRSESNVPGLGRMTLYRTAARWPRRKALRRALMADLGLKSLVPLNRTIERPHAVNEIVYRITVKDDDDPTTTFTRDARQKVNVNGNSFDLRVRPKSSKGARRTTPAK